MHSSFNCLEQANKFTALICKFMINPHPVIKILKHFKPIERFRTLLKDNADLVVKIVKRFRSIRFAIICSDGRSRFAKLKRNYF